MITKGVKMKRLSLLAAIGVMIAAAFGCENTGTDPLADAGDAAGRAEVIDLGDPVGGLTESDEEPAFGEPEEFGTMMAGDEEYEDPLRLEERVREMERIRGARIFRMRALWGRMIDAMADTAGGDCCALDWSGGMHAAGGAIVVERLIRFDPGDRIVRKDRSTVQWVSHTCPGVDGIQVRIIFPPEPPDSANVEPVEPSLTIRTGPFQQTFTLDELVALDLLRPVDRCGNYMMIGGHEVVPACPHGYMSGRWDRAEIPDTLRDRDTGEIRGIVMGRFRGLWISEIGWTAGHVRGFYGTDPAGERRFFGKYIDMRGRFMGIVRGLYGADPAVTDAAAEAGWFKGEWLGRSRVVRGRLEGEWITASPGPGYFKGIWGRDCGDLR